MLIVEDDPALHDSLEASVRADGYSAIAFADGDGDGDAAIEYAAGAKAIPDIAIVDVNLPRGLSGLQVLARLRDLIGHDLPALVLTGDISTETSSRWPVWVMSTASSRSGARS